MSVHAGGCLCGALRYEARADPVRVTVCHCRFCQRATGSAYMVEPIFRGEDLALTAGRPAVFDLRSAGSGKTVHVHFCAVCGTKTHLTFERFPGFAGVYAGTFDEPDWFDTGAHNTKHIFTGVARHDTIIPAGVNTFVEHATTNDGTPCEARILKAPTMVGAVGQG